MVIEKIGDKAEDIPIIGSAVGMIAKFVLGKFEQRNEAEFKNKVKIFEELFQKNAESQAEQDRLIQRISFEVMQYKVE